MRNLIFVTIVCVFMAVPAMADVRVLGLDYDPGWPWPAKQRWKDVAGNMYAGAADVAPDSQDYAGANVQVDYGVTGNRLTGTVTATGLKPNFAYQLKLEGSPSLDEWTNDTLMSIGRTSGSVGYLPFGFIMTDESGSVTSTFVTDSSYHVLWTSTPGPWGSRAPGANDGPVSTFTFDPDPSSPWYDDNPDPATVGIYGEWESGQPLPGTLILPDGTYVCNFVLTEESFHDASAGSMWTGVPGGSWASPFKGDITFAVPVPVPGAVLLGAMGLGMVGWMKRRKQKA